MGLTIKIGADLNKFDRDFKRATGLISGFNSKVTNAGRTLTAGLTAPILGMGTAAVVTTMNFDTEMSKVQAISGATGDDLGKLRDKAKEMGSTTQFSASEAAQAMNYMAMAGYDTTQMMNALPGVLNLAASGGTDLAVASDIVTDAMTAMGMGAEDCEKFVDIMAATVTKSNTNVEMMGDTLKYAAPVAGALGIEMEDLSVAIGLMGNAGIKSTQAGTALRSGLTRLVDPPGEAAKAMKKYNIEVSKNKDGSINLAKTMGTLRSKLGALQPAQQAAALSAIFGKEAMSGWASVVNASEADFNKLTDSIKNSNGVSGEMAKTMQDNLGGSIKELKSAAEGLAIGFGELLTPAIRTIAQGITAFTNKLNSLSTEQKETILKIGGLVAAIGPLLLVVGKVTSGILAFSKTMGALKTLMLGVSAAQKVASVSTVAVGAASTTAAGGVSVLGGSMLTMLGPIALIIGGAIALGVAISTNFLGIRDCITSVLSGVKGFIEAVWEAIKFVWENNLMGIRSYVEMVFNNIKIIIDTVFGVVKGIFDTFAALFRGDWDGFLNGIKNIANTIWEGIKSLIGNVLNGIVDVILNIGATLLNAAYTAFQKCKDGALNAWNNLKAWFGEAVNDPIGTIKNIGSKLFEAGKGMISSIWDGCKSIWNSVVGWFNEKISWLTDKLFFWKKSKGEMESGSKSINEATKESRSFSILNESVRGVNTPISVNTSGRGRNAQTVNNESVSNSTMIINIDKFNNSNDGDIRGFAQKLETYKRQAAIVRGDK